MNESNPKSWWVVLGALLGLTVGNGPIMQFTFGVLIQPLSASFQADRGVISTALLVGLVATGVATPLMGRLMDKYGVRRMALPAIVLFALSMMAMGWVSTSPLTLILMYGLTGVFAAGQTPMPYSKTIAAIFDRRRGLALGIATAGVGLGTILMPLLAQQLVTNFGWRGAYVGLGLVTLLVAFPAMAVLVTSAHASLPDVPQSLPIAAATKPGLTAAQARVHPVFWALAVAFFAVAMAASGVIAHVVPLMVDRGVAASAAVGAISAAGLALLVGRLVAGWMLDRFHGPYVTLVFFSLPLIGIGLLLFSADPRLGIPAAVLVGLGLGAEVDLIAFLQSRYLGLKAFGEIYGYLFAIFMLGSGLGPFVMGQSFRLTHAYDSALWLLIGGLTLACVLTARLGPYAYGASSPAQSPAHGD